MTCPVFQRILIGLLYELKKTNPSKRCSGFQSCLLCFSYQLSYLNLRTGNIINITRKSSECILSLVYIDISHIKPQIFFLGHPHPYINGDSFQSIGPARRGRLASDTASTSWWVLLEVEIMAITFLSLFDYLSALLTFRPPDGLRVLID